MNRSDIEKANDLLARLDRAKDRLKEIDDIKSPFVGINLLDEHRSIAIAKYSDGSGWCVNLEGILPAEVFLSAVAKILEEEIARLALELEAI